MDSENDKMKSMDHPPMKFIVTDRHSIQAGIVVPTPYIVVSIYTPTMPKPVIPRRLGLKEVLYVSFHDAEPTDELPSDIVLMTPKQAAMIWDFVKRHQADVSSIVCHCEAGISRSPAVAIALAESLGADMRKIQANSQPNQYVYRLMREAINANPNGRKSVQIPRKKQ